jgi:hypothetical protein
LPFIRRRGIQGGSEGERAKGGEGGQTIRRSRRRIEPKLKNENPKKPKEK